MRNILHIEPSEFICKIVENIIKDKGYNYLWTNSYNEALIMLEEFDIDMIFFSLIGDGMKNEEFVKNINHISNEIPVCVVSSNKFDKDIQRLMNLGVRQYIDKQNIEIEIIDYIEHYFINDMYVGEMRELKIAAVDDCPFSRMNIKEIFNKYGLKNVKYFASGQELYASNEEFDVYLIDIFLKDEFGKNIIHDLRIKHKDNILILAVTGLENSKILSEIIDIGADDIIPKPIADNLFISKLKSYSRKLIANKNKVTN